MPNVSQIRISRMAMEYVPITGDAAIIKEYTLYPAWVFTIAYEYKDGKAPYTAAVGFHALTGEKLF